MEGFGSLTLSLAHLATCLLVNTDSSLVAAVGLGGLLGADRLCLLRRLPDQHRSGVWFRFRSDLQNATSSNNLVLSCAQAALFSRWPGLHCYCKIGWSVAPLLWRRSVSAAFASLHVPLT